MKKINQILVVEDDWVARFLIERELKKADITENILTATNGEQALQVLKEVCLTETCPELILLDINMPLMDGFEFLEQLPSLKLYPFPGKIFLLSSSSNPKDLEKARQFPVAGYLSKPLTQEMLTTILAAWAKALYPRKVTAKGTKPFQVKFFLAIEKRLWKNHCFFAFLPSIGFYGYRLLKFAS